MNTYAVKKFESEVKKIEESKALLQTMQAHANQQSSTLSLQFVEQNDLPEIKDKIKKKFIKKQTATYNLYT